ncbi:MAG TPA: RNA polymerase sigma factor [Candidatus Eisenbacteria bacterium]|jgi:RNA polymerase sigma-70 factor (ECF subfamily)|nr:RNA polymerase sigma factor [Candidatus Eisenbacteria bacterium]
MTGNANNETDLLARAREGDIDAFSRLVELYQERAIRTAYAILGDMEDARDQAQEAFVKAYRSLSDFKVQSRFYTWFYRILLNTCKDHLRKKKVRGFVRLWTGRTDEDEAELPDAPDDAPDAAETLMGRELSAEIQKALESLPLQQRTAFALRYYEGLSVLETAESMDLSEGAVKAHLWQAGQKMKKILDAWRPDGGNR